ncbi:hypothetical protein R0K05_20870, partial [Planococcus sp. SIMBA_160]
THFAQPLPRRIGRAGSLLPALLFLGAAFVYPVVVLLTERFTGAEGAFTLAHYLKLQESFVVSRVLGITFEIAAWTAAISVLAAYPVAYL